MLVGDLVRGSWERMFPEQENVPEKIFGGYVIRKAFELAMMHAEELAPDRPVFVRVNRTTFHQPVRIGDKLDFTSRITYTGKTSATMKTSIERITRNKEPRPLPKNCIFPLAHIGDAV